MEFVDTQAIYQQVADHVCEMILKGSWPEGERIPSVREMAVELQVNPNTVNKGYAYLQDRELIYNQRGIGYFVSDSAIERTRTIKREEFFSEQLPRLFRTMRLLDITVDDIAPRFAAYKEKEN
ncbi:MAG TPA: GntR family transcriptional regulator [Spirochaetia bacterium]|nr:GntR family transcriptional regulator [Spirochaetia bacterium]